MIKNIEIPNSKGETPKIIEVEVDKNGNEFLSLCSRCLAIKEIKNSDNFWFKREENPIEHDRLTSKYANEDPDSKYHQSHGICPPCRKILYPELYK